MTAWLLAAAFAALAHGSTPAGGMAPSAPGTPALEAQAGCAARWVPTFGGWPGVDGPVEDLAVFDDGLGSGPQLYVAGRFERAGDVEAKLIARWDGLAWAPVGAPLGGTTAVEIRALIVFDDGHGQPSTAGSIAA